MNHIAFILDGNRTWAKNKNLPTFAGHKAGYDNIENTLDICLEKHIQYVSLWVLSDDNIRTRSPDEVAYLFDLLTHGIAKLARTAVKKWIRVCTIGDLSLLPEKCRNNIHEAVDMTKNGTKMTCIIAIGYGGQNEIIRAVRKCISAGVDAHSLDEKTFLQYTDSGIYPAPDMIVRTGGHIRHSGMYLYHSAYSEYYFTSTLWPDFGRVDIEKALLQYENAHRKYGK